MKNALYFGDNLYVLRELAEQHPDGIADLIYLDPPFNSKRDYSVLFRSPKGHESDAQITAFEDSWHWGEQAEREFTELLQQPNTDVAEMMRALRSFLGENDMMAYLTMMANRLLVMRRVLKNTGSLYLHCDPTASHYLKIVLDGVFGIENYLNEVVWKRTTAHNDPKRFGRIHDVIFFYSKVRDRVGFNTVYTSYREDYLSAEFKTDSEGRIYKAEDLTAPWRGGKGGRFTFHGRDPGPNRMWRLSEEKMEELWLQGRIKVGRDGLPLRRGHIVYLDEKKGMPLQDWWDDVLKVGNTSGERLGYPTQKPLALLERIIAASSNEGDIVLDPFCGCGTAVHAAQRLDRNWIGIDITHLAISLIEKRLNDAFPGIEYEVHGTPKDFGGATDLASRDKYQFQWWACSLVGAQPYQGMKKGADGGIDGLIFFQDEKTGSKKIIVSVKGGDHVNVAMIRDLKGVLERENAQIGLFVTLAPATKPMQTEAVAAGFYHSLHFGDFPKIQILTIEGLLNGTERPRYPDMSGGQTFKKAQKEQSKLDQPGLFGAVDSEQ